MKKKIIASVLALTLAVGTLVGGTLAWQSLNQTALNEVSGIVNPGGRLHDDFDGQNKDIYVENFAAEPIFARIQLSEFLKTTGENGKSSVLVGGEKDKVDTYNLYKPADKNVINMENPFRQFVDWDFAGETIYMPTFNQNKDSLEADVNGTLAGPDGKEDEDPNDNLDLNADQYDDYIKWKLGEEADNEVIQDADADNSYDEVGKDARVSISEIVAKEDSSIEAEVKAAFAAKGWDALNNVSFEGKTHKATETPYADVMTMAQWMELGSPMDDIWVYDTDGWAYYAKPIAPGEASGLLLDGISITRIDDNYLYDIYVLAQFVTAGDVGNVMGDGFYDETFGSKPTENAEALLYKIGAMERNITITNSENADGTYAIEVKGASEPISYTVSENNDTDTAVTASEPTRYATLKLGGNENSSRLIVKATDSEGNVVETVIYRQLPAANPDEGGGSSGTQVETVSYELEQGAAQADVPKDKIIKISVSENQGGEPLNDASQWTVKFIKNGLTVESTKDVDYSGSGKTITLNPGAALTEATKVEISSSGVILATITFAST